MSVIDVFVISLVDLCKLDHAFNVRRVNVLTELQIFNTLFPLVIANVTKTKSIVCLEVPLVSSRCLLIVRDSFIILPHFFVRFALLNEHLDVIGL